MYHGLAVVVAAVSEVLSLLLPMMLVLPLFESMIVEGGTPVDVADIGITPPLRLSPPLPIVLELFVDETD